MRFCYTTCHSDVLCHVIWERDQTTDLKVVGSNGIKSILCPSPGSKMTLRWGIVTAGKISNDFVNAFNSFTDKGDQVIVGVAARDKTKAADFAKLHNISKVYDSYQALAASNDIDVAYIGALNPQHYELTKLFLESGKHVLCEKPLCLNYKQAQSLVNISRKKKLFLMEAIWSRFTPAYRALEKELESGKLGDIKLVDVSFGEPMTEIERLSQKALGGSTILDIGIYTLQFAQYVFKDEPIKVTAKGNLGPDGVDSSETVILEYSGGRRAVLNIHSEVKLPNKGIVFGTGGTVTVEAPFHIPTEIKFVDGKVEKFPLHTSNLPYYFTNSAGLVYQTLEVQRCIKAGLVESPRLSHNETLLLSKLRDTVREQLGAHFDADNEEYP